MKLNSLFNVTIAFAITLQSACAADPEALVLVKTIALKGVAGKLDHLAIDSKGERLFVANKPNNTLDIVDLKAGKMVRQIADQGKVSGVCYAADLDMVYVGNGSGTCNAFEGRDFRQVFTTTIPNADNIHYHSGAKTVYVGQDEILTELDAKSGEIKASIKLPGAAHGFKIDKKAGKIYTVLTKPNLLGVVDVASQTVTESFALTLSDAGSPITQDADNGLLFVGCPKKQPMVLVFDAKSGKEIASIVIPAGIDDLHFDKRRQRLYASCADRALVVIEKKGHSYAVVSKIETPKDSRTCVWSSGKLYLAVPQQEGGDGPTVQVYEARPLLDARSTPQ